MASDEVSKEEMLHEAKTMAKITRNVNIVNLQGICEHQNQVFLLLEFCHLGSVESFLKNNADHYSQCIAKNDFQFLIKCCSQVAAGMEFLVEKEIIHGDLGARNILITNDMTIKIADFGLSHRMYMQQGASKGPKTKKVPVQNSAIEILRADHALLESSDVWSFGVYMWEIFLLCLARPYFGVPNGKILNIMLMHIDNYISFSGITGLHEHLERGNRLEKPELCPYEIYGIMTDCWRRNPMERPTFQRLKLRLEAFNAPVNVHDPEIRPEAFNPPVNVQKFESYESYR